MKKFLDHKDLVGALRSYGLDVGDPDEAEAILRRYGYHRLGGYRYPFRELLPLAQQSAVARTYRSDQHIAGTSLRQVVALADFDSKLRGVCAAGVEEFEVRLRTAVAHAIARKSPAGHLDPNVLGRAEATSPRSWDGLFAGWERQARQALAASDDFVVHHVRTSPGDPLPVWAIVEYITLGSLIKLVELMTRQDVAEVALAFGVGNGPVFVKWLRAILDDVRNVASHAGRLFNRSVKRQVQVNNASGVSPLLDHLKLPPGSKPPTDPYRVLGVMAYMLRSHETQSTWPLTLRTQIRKFPVVRHPGTGIEIVSAERSAGFPSGWDSLELWT